MPPGPCSPAAPGLALPLPVLAARPALKKSRAARWRALSLIAVYLVMAIHIVQWLIVGLTISPVEPSESMYTIEAGRLNAGFVFFSLALLSTFLFGRFFCGWGCHIIALQDLCSHWMAKLKVHPRPFRTRLPLYWTTLLGLYMFIYPVFLRSALFPLMRYFNVPKPLWIADIALWPGLKPAFLVENFWATFALPAVAIPFLLICGFATVYFLGNKAFCTYGCPYGGFFAPLDKISIGRIVVSDACNQCGHCTAACTSNVRVHQEVRDFGKVMDPGCMKCMDCVSVCPTNALSFKFALPAAFTRARTQDARAGIIQRPPSDLAWWEELWVFFAGIALFLCFRQFLDQVPLLMAAGIAMISVFGLWKLSHLVFDPNVRLQSLQLKLKGRWTWKGAVFAAGVLALLATGLWSGWVRNTRFRADLVDLRINTPQDVVYAPDYTPDPADKALALQARDLYERTLPPSEGGKGWRATPLMLVRLSWLSAVAGDAAKSESYLRRAIFSKPPGEELVFALERIRALAGDSAEQRIAIYREVLQRYPDLHGARIRLAQLLGEEGKLDEAAQQIEAMFKSERLPGPMESIGGAELLMALGNPQRAVELLSSRRDALPKEALLHAGLARALFAANRPGDAALELESATSLDPDNAPYWEMLAEVYMTLGRSPDAARAQTRAADIHARQPPGAVGPSPK